MLLNIRSVMRMIKTMKHTAFKILVMTLAMTAVPAFAQDCYADYKAKQDDPLRLHYGVAQINGACTAQNAQAELQSRLHQQGWTLLSVLSTFATDGLAERKDSAGPYYLRF